MPTYVMRVWIADRPGALGAIASRIGAVGGDVTGIDILERGAGKVIDELTLDLHDEALVPLMLEKVRELDAVEVEDLRSVGSLTLHPLGDALEIAARLIDEVAVDGFLDALLAGAASASSGEWSAVLDADTPAVVATSPEAPGAAWLEAFVTGLRSATGEAIAANDVAAAPLSRSGLCLLVGRSGRPFRDRERRQLVLLARVADHRWRELTKETRPAHASQP